MAAMMPGSPPESAPGNAAVAPGQQGNGQHGNGQNGNGRNGGGQNGGGRAGQDGPPIDLVERLRADLARPGPDGAEARGAAIERLLSMAEVRAHEVLMERLADTEDRDRVRAAVLQALARRLVNPADLVFGERQQGLELRRRLVRAYAAALVRFWRGEADGDGLLPDDPLRAEARRCIVRMPVLALADGLRDVAVDPAAEMDLRVAALRAAADAQNLELANLLAEFVGAAEPQLRTASRAALRLLTFAERDFTSLEQVQGWFAKLGERDYFDLAEESAREVGLRLLRKQEELEKVSREAAAEYVRAVTERRERIDWAAVQARTLGGDAATTRACLDQLRETIVDLPGGDDSQARLAFARALLERYRKDRDVPNAPRARMLEVAAYLCRPSETELAAELATELRTQLGTDDQELQLAALRGLRRYPSPEARADVVRLAAGTLLRQPEIPMAVLAQALQTLGAGESSWRAPVDTASDKGAWLQLLRDVATGPFSRERRNAAIAVAMLPDRDGKRVPQVFDLLLEIARDTTKEPSYRTSSLVKLMDWRDQEVRADELVRELTQLLADPERDVRQHAAETLTNLPEANQNLKKAWIKAIKDALRERLRLEDNKRVLESLLGCLHACSQEPGSSEVVIGTLNDVLEAIGFPVPAEDQERVDQLLAALMKIAADQQRSSKGQQWLGACDMLLRHKQRKFLRHVLANQNAILLAQQLGSGDPSIVDRAQRAMRLVLLAADLKPPELSWTQSEELRREAGEVRDAFDALGPGARLPASLDEPRFRLMRLEVMVATGNTQKAIELADGHLKAAPAPDKPPLDAAALDTVRMLAAEALLLERKVDEAAARASLIDRERAKDPRALRLYDAIGGAYMAANQPARALAWLRQAVDGTRDDQPEYRARLVALWQARVGADPAERAAVKTEIEQKATLFDLDCPEQLKEAVNRLKGG